MKIYFKTLNARIEDMDNEDSDLTNSDDDDEEKSYFQFEETDWSQGVHQLTGALPNKRFMFIQTLKKRIDEFFFKNRTIQ